mgnify:CR=1
MSKSIIPFIFENSCLSDIFIEASSSKNISEMFHFEITNLKKIKIYKSNILITDNSTLNNIVKEDLIKKN